MNESAKRVILRSMTKTLAPTRSTLKPPTRIKRRKVTELPGKLLMTCAIRGAVSKQVEIVKDKQITKTSQIEEILN